MPCNDHTDLKGNPRRSGKAFPWGKVAAERGGADLDVADAVCHIADGRDLVAADGHAALIDLARVNMDDLTILDDQIGRLHPLCNSQQFLVHHAASVFMIS